MIKLKRIDFLNYRIAGTYSLSFDDSGNDYHMFGIVAENGTGKTTILNAITWCLYEKEYQLKDVDRALPIINSKKLHEMELNSFDYVGVRVTIIDGEKEIVFDRKLKCIRIQNDDGVPIARFDTQSEFAVTVSDLNSPDSTITVSPEDREFYVADYFENSIHDFFFFDGERLEEFFSDKKASSIQASVEAIAQISLLDTTIQNAQKMAATLSREVAKSRPNLKKLEAERDKAKKAWDSDLVRIADLEKEREDASAEKRKIDDLLNENAASAALQEQKKLLDEKLKGIKDEQDKLYKKRVQFAVRSATLIKFYPKIVVALKLIEEKGEAGDYSVYLTRKQLEAILKEATNHDTNCPVCGSGLQMKQMLYIQKIISRQTVDDDMAMTLSRLKEDLTNAKKDIVAFREVNHEYSLKEIELQDKYAEVEKEYNKVSEKLSKLKAVKDENGNVIDFSKLELQSRKLDSDIAGINQSIGAAKTLAGIHENAYYEKNAAYESGVKRENDDAESQAVIDTLHMIYEQLTCVKVSITQDVREKLEEITRSIFMRVIKKKKTFGKISINNDYRLDLYDEYGQLMTGSSCATEYMTLAYAYTLAIHEASGHNCPLVIDYPLGRISGEIRENTADMLLETSREKQIIMLLTEDEYSEKVQKLFEGKAVMRNISLAEHERSWEEAEI